MYCVRNIRQNFCEIFVGSNIVKNNLSNKLIIIIILQEDMQTELPHFPHLKCMVIYS